MHSFTSMLCTVFYIGFIPFAPGTFGSLAGVVVGYILRLDPFVMFVVASIGFVVGYIFSDIYAHKKSEGDPKEVVIDEVIGMLFALCTAFFLDDKILAHDSNAQMLMQDSVCFYNAITVFICFILFRIYDIKKPWIIRKIDQKMQGGLGIMLDDAVAGIFAGITFIVIMPFFNLLLIICKNLY